MTREASDAALLSARGLNKYYGGLRALRDVDLDIVRGEIIALVGDNGAGKSTLIKTLSGAIVPDGGDIVFDGSSVSFHKPTDAQDVGIETVHQSLGLVDELDVPQNVFLGRELTRKVLGAITVLDKATMRQRTHDLLQNFSIGLPTLNEPVRRLSGGQRQTIAISRLLLAEPQLLIMDEPMAALGVDEGSKVLALVERLREQGITTLIISHNLEHVFSIADRIAVMKNGAMIGVVKTSDVTREDIVSMITIGQA
ncbi:ATP-binding cassette domain-containing protein [Hoeflea sp. YIM 152468]|uniref:ATP-binding cassette domain-containing protein n=1 Tax=Hoeflea sp. YIM 152468 TaxID=3031759 RepID=UPI0023DA6AB0|nr:ATP-binding cassette domain-containing protein [Hoeflea sp. YIM 152468]MDF1608656.1 ATP-binding cassette domain-containing protein [Hoeflea sp. YIM 152468]